MQEVEHFQTTYRWAHLHTQHWFWNQTPGEGLDSLLFLSCPECEALGGFVDTHKPPRLSPAMLEFSLKNQRVASMRLQVAEKKALTIVCA